MDYFLCDKFALLTYMCYYVYCTCRVRLGTHFLRLRNPFGIRPLFPSRFHSISEAFHKSVAWCIKKSSNRWIFLKFSRPTFKKITLIISAIIARKRTRFYWLILALKICERTVIVVFKVSRAMHSKSMKSARRMELEKKIRDRGSIFIRVILKLE